MFLRKFCLPRNFSQFSRVFRPDLVNKTFQQCRFESVNRPIIRESQFLAQFVPNYFPEKKEVILDDGFIIESDYSGRSKEELVQIFERLSYHCSAMESSISEEKYDPIVNAVLAKLPEMSDDELLKILVDLTRFPLCKTPRAHNFSELWNKIDDECWDRSRRWRYPLLLKIMSAYYRLGLNRISSFNTKALLRMSAKCDQLSPQMLVELMFYQSIIRHEDVPMYTIEAQVSKSFNEFNIDELGIIGLAFFKREAKIVNVGLLIKFYWKVFIDLYNF